MFGKLPGHQQVYKVSVRQEETKLNTKASSLTSVMPIHSPVATSADLQTLLIGVSPCASPATHPTNAPHPPQSPAYRDYTIYKEAYEQSSLGSTGCVECAVGIEGNLYPCIASTCPGNKFRGMQCAGSLCPLPPPMHRHPFRSASAEFTLSRHAQHQSYDSLQSPGGIGSGSGAGSPEWFTGSASPSSTTSSPPERPLQPTRSIASCKSASGVSLAKPRFWRFGKRSASASASPNGDKRAQGNGEGSAQGGQRSLHIPKIRKRRAQKEEGDSLSSNKSHSLAKKYVGVSLKPVSYSIRIRKVNKKCIALPII